MIRLILRLLCVLCALTFAVPPLSAQKTGEESELQEALSEAGSSVDFIRVLEAHLKKYPDSPQRPELERALVKAALENKDDRRIILYGERVLARDPDDLQLLDRVARALLAGEPVEKDRAARALEYAQRFEKGVRAADKSSNHAKDANWRAEVDRTLGRALLLQAKATGSLGRFQEAVALAGRSYETYPTAQAAYETGQWLARSGGKEQEALAHYADAFAIPDSRATDEFRATVRARMGELYRKLKGSETGLGDLVLQSYDRTTALLAERKSRERAADPNSQLTSPAEFTLTGLAGDKLPLASLRGKVLVMDFWATWCGPCRVQHPLYEKVKQRFKSRTDVVFLSINTDEERDAVPGFLEEHHWDKRVYFEDGLSDALRVTSIPTTILMDRKGEVVSRMNGFVPDRFVDMLSERIDEALGSASGTQASGRGLSTP